MVVKQHDWQSSNSRSLRINQTNSKKIIIFNLYHHRRYLNEARWKFWATLFKNIFPFILAVKQNNNQDNSSTFQCKVLRDIKGSVTSPKIAWATSLLQEKNAFLPTRFKGKKKWFRNHMSSSAISANTPQKKPALIEYVHFSWKHEWWCTQILGSPRVYTQLCLRLKLQLKVSTMMSNSEIRRS